MSDVTKIKLPDNSEYNLKDYRIPGVDTTPTSGSDNVVTSGGVYEDIDNKTFVISTALNDLNDRLTEVENSTELLNDNVGDGSQFVLNSDYDEDQEVIARAINDLNDKKQEALEFDSIPTENSTNPVTSGGVYSTIIENELATSSALNDLNDRVTIIEDDGIIAEPFSEIDPVSIEYYTKVEIDDLLSGIDTEETDPIFEASPAANITQSDINTWNSKQASLVSGTNIKTINNTSLLGSGNINTPDTKNTAGTTNNTSKLYLVGATSQSANSQTYSNENVYEQNGELTASKFNGSIETSYTDTTNSTSMYKSMGLNRKVYTGVLGVANGSAPNNNTYANQSVYFLTIHPTSWDAEWGIKYKLNIHLDDETQLYKSSSTAGVVNAGANMRGIYDCNINGTGGAYSTFHMFQSQKNTSYRPIYYHMFHSTTSTGFTAGNGHKMGVCFYSSYLPTPTTDYSSGSAVSNVKYTRTIEVIVEEAINCTFELANTLEVEGDAYRDDYTKLNTTYYTTNTSSSNSAGRWINLAATTQGLYESGDDNTYTYTQQSSNYLKNVTKSGNAGLKLWSYPLIGFDKNGDVLGISVYSSSQSSNTTSISAKGTRLYCTEGFDYTKGIRYVSTSSAFAYNADMNVSTQTNYSGVDLRYSDNCVPAASANSLGMVNRKPVYLRGTIGSDGLFYLAPIDVTYNSATYQRAWTQDIPSVQNEDGEYVYWFIGYPYYNSSYAAALYQLNLITQSELVWYKDGSLRPYTPNSSSTDNVWETGTGTNSAIIKGSLGTAGGNYSTVEGKGSVTGGTHTAYDLTPDTADNTAGSYAHAEGRYTIACGKQGSHAEGDRTLASGSQSHAEGASTIASGQYSHAEGGLTKATASGAHAEGVYSIASGPYSHAEGQGSVAFNGRSHAEGYYSFAAEAQSHAECDRSIARGISSHSEALSCSYGLRSHVEGGNKGIDVFPVGAANATSYTSTWDTEFDPIRNVIGDTILCNIIKGSAILTKNATAMNPIIITDASLSNNILSFTLEKTLSNTALDGSVNYWIIFSIAYGDTSHSENSGNVSYGENSHAEGNYNVALGKDSHVEGLFTFTNNVSEHAEGSYNLSTKTSDAYGNAGNTQHSIGIGDSTARKNAVEVMQNGDTYIYGVGSYNGTNYSTASTLQTVVNSKYEKPSGGIPAADIASGVIPTHKTLAGQSLTGTGDVVKTITTTSTSHGISFRISAGKCVPFSAMITLGAGRYAIIVHNSPISQNDSFGPAKIYDFGNVVSDFRASDLTGELYIVISEEVSADIVFLTGHATDGENITPEVNLRPDNYPSGTDLSSNIVHYYSKPVTGIPASDIAAGVIPAAVTESTVSGWGFTKNAAPGTLITNASAAQTASSGESMSGSITLHKIAKTGTYSDLIGKPTIPAAQVQSDWNATSGMGVILNKPEVPCIIFRTW